MTIVSHAHRLIFLKSRKTAGTSIEQALLRITGPADWVATSRENEPLAAPFWTTPNRTSAWPAIERPCKRLLRRLGPRALRLREHMSAAALRGLLGESVWNGYRKLAVERDPWRRLVSLWRWRVRREGQAIDFDAFLSAIESGSRARQKAVGARRWSNRPFYEIEGQLVVDRVLRFETIAEDLADSMRDFGLPDPGPLPRTKVIHSGDQDPAEILTRDQIERIARLCAVEIERFSYRPPHR